MMSVKKFNREFESVSKDTLRAEDEAHLHCILSDVLNSLESIDLNESSEDVATFILNIHHVVLNIDTKSGVFRKTIDVLGKIVDSFRNKTEIASKLRLLPLLTDALTLSNCRIDYFLRMIEEITFGISIKLSEPFLEQLIKYTIRIITNDTAEHDLKIRIVALSVLINLCYNNFAALSILNAEINIVDLQKSVSVDKYGFLSCKLIVVLNDCGHLLCDTDVRNYLKSTLNELHRIPTLEPHILRHLVEFMKEIAERSNTKDVFQKYDFHVGIEGAIMILENSPFEAKSINSIFQIIQTILKANNNSLKKLLITILNFAIKKLKSPECQTEAIETITCVFNSDPKISTSAFELEDLQSMLRILIEIKKQNSKLLISGFKLLAVMAKCFKVNLLSQNLVNTILSPIFDTKDIEYFKMDKIDLTMYLQCINTLTVLHQLNLFCMKVNIFQKENVQQLIAMAIKHGDAEQCSLGLKVVGNAPIESISKIITSGTTREEIIETEKTTASNGFTNTDPSIQPLDQNRIDEIFKKIENAFANDILDSQSTFEIIDLYSNKISWLKRRNELLTNKVKELSKEITLKDRDIYAQEILSTKWEERWKINEKTCKALMKEKAKLESIVSSVREQLKQERLLNVDNGGKLEAEKRKTAELEEKVASLEDELKEIEDMRLSVLNMMTKRKKQSLKENVSNKM